MMIVANTLDQLTTLSTPVLGSFFLIRDISNGATAFSCPDQCGCRSGNSYLRNMATDVSTKNRRAKNNELQRMVEAFV
jgi:hypothetical protein